MKERLIHFIKSQGMMISVFQRRIGVSESYIRNISHGIGTEVLLSIEREYPMLNTRWLLTGEGEMLKRNADAGEETEKEDDAPKGKMIPLMPVSAQAGRLNDFVTQIHDYHCDRIFTPIPEAELALTVSGDSMSPEYESGCIVLVKRETDSSSINWGKTYVLDTSNGVVIKNVSMAADNMSVDCVSVNRAYPTFNVLLRNIYGWYRVLMCMTMK